MTSLIRLSKFGIIISLIMVAHSLVYPNELSLIITIAGYIIAVVSTVVYALIIPPINSSSEDLTRDLENSHEIKTEALEKKSLKLSKFDDIVSISGQSRSNLSFGKPEYTLKGESHNEWRESNDLGKNNYKEINVPECQ